MTNTILTKEQDPTIWNKSIERCIREILNTCAPDNKHHFGRPFLTAYQIAIEFEKRYEEETKQVDKHIGGKDTGHNDSLARYLANELSKRIKSGELADIEGRFLCKKHLQSLMFGGNIEATGYSMFRLLDSE